MFSSRVLLADHTPHERFFIFALANAHNYSPRNTPQFAHKINQKKLNQSGIYAKTLANRTEIFAQERVALVRRIGCVCVSVCNVYLQEHINFVSIADGCGVAEHERMVSIFTRQAGPVAVCI